MAKNSEPQPKPQFPALVDHPAYQAADARSRLIRDARERAELRLETLKLQRAAAHEPFSMNTERGRLSAALLRENLRRLDATKPTAEATPSKDAAPEIIAALELIAGGAPPLPANDFDKQIEDAKRAIEILRAGDNAQSQICEQLGQDISRSVARTLVPKRNEKLRALYAAMRDASDAVEALRAFRADFAHPGYQLGAVSDIIGVPAVQNVLGIGREADTHSELAFLRAFLEREGIR